MDFIFLNQEDLMRNQRLYFLMNKTDKPKMRFSRLINDEKTKMRINYLMNNKLN